MTSLETTRRALARAYNDVFAASNRENALPTEEFARLATLADTLEIQLCDLKAEGCKVCGYVNDSLDLAALGQEDAA